MKRLVTAMVALTLVLALSGCSRPPWEWTGCYYDHPACTQPSHDTMTQIVDALNAKDAAALKAVFTQRARTEHSAEIDDGIAYLLSMFPDGDIVWLDPDEKPRIGPTSNDYGDHRIWVDSIYHVKSGESEYQLSFGAWQVNEIDPSDVGVSQMGAIPSADVSRSYDSNLDAALRSMDINLYWSLLPQVLMLDSGPSSPDRAAQIVAALNAQDAGALRGMFTEDARAGFSAEIDEGLDYLLSQFPNGDLVIQEEDPGRTIISERITGDTKSVLLSSFYLVSSGGVDYRLYFAEFTERTADPGGVGIHAIGAVPASDKVNFFPQAGMYEWTMTVDVDGEAEPGIYIPAP